LTLPINTPLVDIDSDGNLMNLASEGVDWLDLNRG
jgi:hypothetical protein